MTEFNPGDLIERFQGEKISTIKNGVPLTFKNYGSTNATLQVKESHEVFFSSNFRKWVEIKLPDVKRKIKVGDLVSFDSCEIIVNEIANTIILGCDKAGEKVLGWKNKCKLIKTAEELKAEEIAAQKEKDNLDLFEKDLQFERGKYYFHKRGAWSYYYIIKSGFYHLSTDGKFDNNSGYCHRYNKDIFRLATEDEIVWLDLCSQAGYFIPKPADQQITEPEKQACRDIDEKIKSCDNNNFTDSMRYFIESANEIKCKLNINENKKMEAAMSDFRYATIKMQEFWDKTDKGVKLTEVPHNIPDDKYIDLSRSREYNADIDRGDRLKRQLESAQQHSERLKSLFLKSTTCSGTELLVYMINKGIL